MMTLELQSDLEIEATLIGRSCLGYLAYKALIIASKIKESH